MGAAAAFVMLIAAVSVFSPVQGLDYFTGKPIFFSWALNASIHHWKSLV